MEAQFPSDLAQGARTRQPLDDTEHDDLVATSLEIRCAARAAGLDRATGRVELDVPEIPLIKAIRKGTPLLPPAPDATGGTIKLVRSAWIAKFDPTLAIREKQKPPAERKVRQSDPVHVDWGDPIAQLQWPWIHSHLMKGATAGIPALYFGDLIFVERTLHLPGDRPLLARPCLVGLWWFEMRADRWFRDHHGKKRWVLSAATFPLRLFNFPVPVKEMGQVDAKFQAVAAFRDRGRNTFLPLSADEAVVITRACGLPATILTEPDPDRLAAIVAGGKFGPPQLVQQRILDGAHGVAHRDSVEKAARDVAIDALRKANFHVISTEDERGSGSDLWAKAIEGDNSVLDLHVEAKGLSGHDPWATHLTWRQREEAVADGGKGAWRLLILINALNARRKERWLSSEEAARVFCVPERGGSVYSADRSVATTLRWNHRSRSGLSAL